MGNKLLTTREAAAFLGVKYNTLVIWRSTGRQVIPYVKIGRSIRYRPSDLEKFLIDKTN